MCSSPSVLSSEDLRLIKSEIDTALRRLPSPHDPAERAKEREHEAAMHRRECELANAKHERTHKSLCAGAENLSLGMVAWAAICGIVAVVFFMSQCATKINMPAPTPPSAEQMFGMGGK